MGNFQLLPGVEVVIANPETKGQCADSHLGEIWVTSAHNAMGYFTVYGVETSLHADHFNARYLSFGRFVRLNKKYLLSFHISFLLSITLG